MVEVKNSCDNCVHKPVCKYTEQFQKSMVDIVKVANDHFEAYVFNGFGADNMLWRLIGKLR